MTYRTNRLFDVPGRTSSKSAKNRARQLAGRISLFDLAPSDPRACPACSGIDDGCTCSSTGAEALALEVQISNIGPKFTSPEADPRLAELIAEAESLGYSVTFQPYCEDSETPGLLGQFAGVCHRPTKRIKVATTNASVDRLFEVLAHEIRHARGADDAGDCLELDLRCGGSSPKPNTEETESKVDFIEFAVHGERCGWPCERSGKVVACGSDRVVTTLGFIGLDRRIPVCADHEAFAHRVGADVDRGSA